MRCEHRRIRNSVDSVPDRKVGQSHRSMRVTLHEARTKEQMVGPRGRAKGPESRTKDSFFRLSIQKSVALNLHTLLR